MNRDQLEYIINSDLPSFKKSELIKELYDREHADVSFLQDGGNLTPDQKAGRKPIKIEGREYFMNGDGELIPAEHFERHPEERGQQEGNSDIIHPTEEIELGDQEFDVAVADTPEKRKEGLSNIKRIEEGEGMLFIFDSPVSEYFTMVDTAVDLDIIFIDEEGVTIEVKSVKGGDLNPVTCSSPYQFVLETKIHSGIRKGDELSVEDLDFSDEEKEQIHKSKMLVLNSDGDVQMKLVGGERIVSMIKTRQLIKAALKAYRTDNDSDYRRVGKIILTELNEQDERTPQYVEK